jgi:hypothetical protein
MVSTQICKAFGSYFLIGRVTNIASRKALAYL